MSHAFFKRVKEVISERPSSAIDLMEFKEALLANCPVEWIQIHGIDIRNPDGSFINTGPRQGFHLRSEPQSFFHCYSFYGGIVAELSDRQDVFEMIGPVAVALRALIFRM